MPPKKLPSKLTTQGSTLNAPSTAHSYRQPVPTRTLPPTETIPPLWTPTAVPTEGFPEWTDPAALPAAHWATAEEPFEDSLAPEKLLVPHEATDSKDTITWKRPSQFLPVILDAPVPATPPPPTPEPKAAAAKKGGAPVAKKAEPELPKKLPPPKHANVFVSKSERSGGATINSSALPSAAVDHHHDHALRIPRDFQRRWSAEQSEALQAWAKEEERIEREQQLRERVYMAFEDTIAYIVNERPRDLLAEVDFDADDLVDDGEDEDDALTTDVGVSNASSPWGVMPPPRIEIAPNAVYKPEVPHGEIIHADMASYFRIVEQLYNSTEQSDTLPSPAPFLWQAIYPQDSTGQPVYNPGGKYSVKLFVFGRWRRVDVDDKLPLDADGNIVYLASSMKSEIWPCLLVKALYKVAYWLHPNSPQAEVATNDMCQNMVLIMLALTSWKVSRWEPGQSDSENVFHQLLQYVPSSQEPEQVEENSEDTIGSETIADARADTPPAVTEIPDKSGATNVPKPRAVICCAGANKVAEMIFGEVVLVTDVVGDTGNTTFKVVRQGSPATISEETNGVNDLVVLLVHPVLQYSDIFVREWSPNPEAHLEALEESRAALVPFESPRVQFLVVTTPDSAPKQTPGDSSSDMSHVIQAPVHLVATLTPVQPPEKTEQELDNERKSSELMAAHLGVDPNGSVVLIEEMENRETSRSSLPAIVTLNSIFSGYISIPPLDKGNIVYRVYPQKTLRYGYSIQVESDHKVAFLDALTYWHTLSDLHVTECDGAYPVMLPGTWNLLFKQSFELVPPTQEDGDQQLIPALRIDLHLSEELLSSFTHISIVHDATGEVKKVSTLCTTITLPTASNTANRAPTAYMYTVIVDCAPGNFHVREGKWKLTLASEWDFAKCTTHQMKMTQFVGVFEPNKPLMCFRDVIMAPKTSIWTSFQFELLSDEAVANGLAAKLEVFDLAAEQNPQIGEVSSKGETRLLQLPLVTTAHTTQPPSDDKRGYIVQGSIDRTTCIVPDDLQSLRPFRSNSHRPPPPKELLTAAVDENASWEAKLLGDSAELRPGTAHSSRASSGIKWRLNCWSSEEVKLQQDNTKELQFEAIRASWAEKAADRSTNGVVSRLLYLGKMDEAEARMKQENLSDEQIAKARGRFEWAQAVRTKVATTVEGAYLEETTSSEEKLLSEVELAESKRLLLERIGVVEADKEQRRVARALAKEGRAKQLKSMVRAVIDRRATSLKKQQELKRQLAAVQTRSA
ncbi:hypothetical protein PHYPSEUDO_001168 [Phytophthora pseudosyringae]|uniref:Calpain catalytic domain-containing protein n=1 Tax=Phytophthora pseudosyringae TaxID=221518 RepID=A0A8T1W166_9STRA|nr:hypothetical protein PHYPSEUDO_001168 [Phytophthora pseudosyringae]